MKRWSDIHYGKPLKPREQQVLERAAMGDDRDETAQVLHLSPWTVQTHRRNLLGKLGAKNMPHAVAIGFQRGLLGDEG